MILLFSTCRKSVEPGAASDPGDLLPGNNDISGFMRKGNSAIMTDYQTIMDAIDGAAQKFIDYGFIEGVNQLYSNGTVDIDVRIMNHGTKDNANKIFMEFYPSSPEVLYKGADGGTVVVEHALLTGYSLSYVRDNVYMEIVSTSEKTPFTLNTLKQFYWNIDGKLDVR